MVPCKFLESPILKSIPFPSKANWYANIYHFYTLHNWRIMCLLPLFIMLREFQPNAALICTASHCTVVFWSPYPFCCGWSLELTNSVSVEIRKFSDLVGVWGIHPYYRIYILGMSVLGRKYPIHLVTSDKLGICVLSSLVLLCQESSTLGSAGTINDCKAYIDCRAAISFLNILTPKCFFFY